MAPTFHYVVLRTFAHATEDADKVKQALLFAVGGAAEVRDSVAEGQHKNPIHILEVELKARAAVDRFFARLAAEAGDAVPTLRRQMDQRLDDDQMFYLRLAKQEAYLGRLALTSGEDAIQVKAKVAAFPARLDAARKTLAGYLDGLIERRAST